ncbi:MAG: carbon-nitrogen hydrolase [Deltaproteobacteria bacterium]|nr:carbon-nitrogen hydrolase [Deltaproteobacteria bacterium]MBW1984239.1 carbon-nitrogen hydrolase [Deltaproteobacteria bacterium]MBW2179808.1 carbon-nitrogen hydrolase [Deltaproteobacteria bacterium]
MKSIKLAVVQFTPAFKRKEENLSRIQELISNLEADIIVLPELCTTGYFFLSRDETSELAEPISGPTCQFFQKISKQSNAVVVAGFIEKKGNKIFNSCLIAQPGKKTPRVYRKTHLFYKEPFCFDPGDTGFFVVQDTVRDVNIGPMICYDWRFPESARVLTLLGADLIVCPSNLITDAWRTVMPARAIENKVYVAVANRAGTEQIKDEELLFKGNSTIYDYDGIAVYTAGASGDEVMVTKIFPSLTRDKSFNEFNDVLKDRRPKHYKPLA